MFIGKTGICKILKTGSNPVVTCIRSKRNMKTQKFNIIEMSPSLKDSKITLKKWSGRFSQLTVGTEDQKSLFLPTHNVTFEYPYIILGSEGPISRGDLKWWGTFKQLLDTWEKEKKGYYLQEIEVRGTGYKFEVEGNKLKIDLGKSHEYLWDIPSEVEFLKEKNMSKNLKGVSTDKNILSQYLANIRKLFPLNMKQHGIVLSPIKYVAH